MLFYINKFANAAVITRELVCHFGQKITRTRTTKPGIRPCGVSMVYDNHIGLKHK